MPRTGISAERPARGAGLRARLTRLVLGVRNRVILALHRLADRLDLIPPEYGREQPVDAQDPDQVLAEWARYMRLWADYNPEEVFALKVGAVLLVAAVLALWALIGAFF